MIFNDSTLWIKPLSMDTARILTWQISPQQQVPLCRTPIMNTVKNLQLPLLLQLNNMFSKTSFKYRDRLNTRLREQRPVNLSKSRKSGEQSKQEWYYLKMTIFKKSSFWMFFTLICQRLNLIQNIETFIFKWKFEESIACMRLKKPLQWELRGEVMFK